MRMNTADLALVRNNYNKSGDEIPGLITSRDVPSQARVGEKLTWRWWFSGAIVNIAGIITTRRLRSLQHMIIACTHGGHGGWRVIFIRD